MSRIVIQSLMNQDSCSETYVSDASSDDDDYKFLDMDHLESCCSSSSSPHHHHHDLNWIDHMEMAYSYHVETRVEFGGFEDYSQVCYGMGMGIDMEEDYYNVDLWQ
ncbi:hypothetical protein ACS0TY_018412 [Phlomoides rotata]